MADDETETNPRKKLKIEHVADDFGDNNAADSTQDIHESEKLNKEKELKSDTGSGESNLVQSNEIDSHTPEEASRQENRSENSASEENITCDDDDNKNVSDEESEVSSISDMSDMSGEDSWKARALGPLGWVYKAMEDGVDPRDILRQAIPDEADIPDVDNFTLWKLVVNLVSEPPPRIKLPDVNTLDDVVQLLHKCQKIMVLTGAGVSVSCGIPDFRSRNGIYARLAVDFPDLPDPQAMFDISYFRKDQRPFFKFAKEIFPGQFEPSKSHKFINLIEEHGKLLRNYTQNIDTLEQVAGIKNVIQCHGSFATATCMTCHHKISMEDIKSDVMEQNIPWCDKCDPRTPLSIMKPDIVFFGESLPDEFHHQMSLDKDNCDLLIVIGSSLKVRPVALIPNSLPAHVPQILINKEHLRHLNFDVELLGDCDTVINELCRRLGNGWTQICNQTVLTQIGIDNLLTPPLSPVQLDDGKPDSAISTTGLLVENKKNGNSESADSTQKCLTKDDKNGEKEEDNSTICGAESKEAKNSVDNLKLEAPQEVSSSIQDNISISVDSESNKQPLPKDDTTISEKVAENENASVAEQPGCSYNDSDKAELADNNVITSSYWIPKRRNVADRLGIEQFCFIPPCKYVFPEAEFYTTFDTDNDSDDKDTSMESDLDFEQNYTTTTTGSDNMNGDDAEMNTDDDVKDTGVAMEEQNPAKSDNSNEKNDNS